MKAAILAISLLLVLACGEALQCNKCNGEHCTPTVEKCSPDKDACASLVMTTPKGNMYVKSCMKMNKCNRMNMKDSIDGICCNKDLCN